VAAIFSQLTHELERIEKTAMVFLANGDTAPHQLAWILVGCDLGGAGRASGGVFDKLMNDGVVCSSNITS
jgi:hypothetical protein